MENLMVQLKFLPLKLSLLFLTTNAHRLQNIRYGTKERFQFDKYDRSESKMTLQAWIEPVTPILINVEK